MRKLLCLLVLFHLLVVAVAQNNTGLTLKMVDKPISLVLNEITKKRDTRLLFQPISWI